MKRVTEKFERLARDICWDGFHGRKSFVGQTKAEYWDGMPQEMKDQYIREAKHYWRTFDRIGWDKVRWLQM